ncbi:MAG: hypothetical protein ABL963_00170 [Longimicrobiales bacterium]
MRRGALTTALRVGAVVVATVPATTQVTAAQEHSEPRGAWGMSLVAAEPVGELAIFFDRGFGGQIDAAWPMSHDGRLRLRSDLGFLVYGYENLHYCYSVPIGCRIEADLTTMNNIVYGGLGPEVAFRVGALEPYAYATAGLSYFATVSSLGDEWSESDWAETTNYSDLVMAWKLGGGMRLRVSRGARPVSLDFGVERHRNGIAAFLTPGDIVDNPDGSITVYPNRSEANLTTFRFGVSMGIGGRRD